MLLIASVSSTAQENPPFIQADVYDALYQAFVQCDSELEQSRSEFITDMFERNRGNRISVDLLRKLIAHNVRVANLALADRLREREQLVAEILQPPTASSDEGSESAEAAKNRHERVRQFDDFIMEKRRYVKVHQCVLEAL